MASNTNKGDASIGLQKALIGQLISHTSIRSFVGIEGPGGAIFGPEEAKAAVHLQSAWRRRMAYIYAKDLKQLKLCHSRREEMKAGISVECDACASAGKKSADIKSRVQKKAWRKTDDLLFSGMSRLQFSDRGDNWNERWQDALALPAVSELDKMYKRSSLDAVYSDFVHTAVTYGRTIISEFFLHEYMKSVRPKQLGGVAGGKKYLWRGILFKLADGSQGPYGGSDEAAAKAAGHELRGGSEYLRHGEGLSVPPMCLLDYKGFRMLAQAHVPLGPTSLKMGTPDGGRTVLNSSPALTQVTKKAAKKLGLRGHTVGGRLALQSYREAGTSLVKKRKVNTGGQVLHTAADVEGHEGEDSRMYLLDLARAFPPEDPSATPHLSGMLSVSAKVIVRTGNQANKTGTVSKAHTTLLDYDIMYPDGEVEEKVPADKLRDMRLFIFYRLMRPEFVRDRGNRLLRRMKLPPDYKFPRVVVTNPMMFAIAAARAAPSPEKKALPICRERYAAGSSTRSRYKGGKGLSPVVEKRRASGAPLEDVEEHDSEGEDCPEEVEGTPGKGRRQQQSAYATGFTEEGRIRADRFDSGYGDGREKDGKGGLTDKEARENWMREAMECGIEFVETRDKYYEGFSREELELDETEIKIRGGIGYQPFLSQNSVEVDDDACDPEALGEGAEPLREGNRVKGGRSSAVGDAGSSGDSDGDAVQRGRGRSGGGDDTSRSNGSSKGAPVRSGVVGGDPKKDRVPAKTKPDNSWIQKRNDNAEGDGKGSPSSSMVRSSSSSSTSISSSPSPSRSGSNTRGSREVTFPKTSGTPCVGNSSGSSGSSGGEESDARSPVGSKSCDFVSGTGDKSTTNAGSGAAEGEEDDDNEDSDTGYGSDPKQLFDRKVVLMEARATPGYSLFLASSPRVDAAGDDDDDGDGDDEGRGKKRILSKAMPWLGSEQELFESSSSSSSTDYEREEPPRKGSQDRYRESFPKNSQKKFGVAGVVRGVDDEDGENVADDDDDDEGELDEWDEARVDSYRGFETDSFASSMVDSVSGGGRFLSSSRANDLLWASAAGSSHSQQFGSNHHNHGIVQVLASRGSGRPIKLTANTGHNASTSSGLDFRPPRSPTLGLGSGTPAQSRQPRRSFPTADQSASQDQNRSGQNQNRLGPERERDRSPSGNSYTMPTSQRQPPPPLPQQSSVFSSEAGGYDKFSVGSLISQGSQASLLRTTKANDDDEDNASLRPSPPPQRHQQQRQQQQSGSQTQTATFPSTTIPDVAAMNSSVDRGSGAALPTPQGSSTSLFPSGYDKFSAGSVLSLASVETTAGSRPTGYKAQPRLSDKIGDTGDGHVRITTVRWTDRGNNRDGISNSDTRHSESTHVDNNEDVRAIPPTASPSTMAGLVGKKKLEQQEQQQRQQQQQPDDGEGGGMGVDETVAGGYEDFNPLRQGSLTSVGTVDSLGPPPDQEEVERGVAAVDGDGAAVSGIGERAEQSQAVDSSPSIPPGDYASFTQNSGRTAVTSTRSIPADGKEGELSSKEGDPSSKSPAVPPAASASSPSLGMVVRKAPIAVPEPEPEPEPKYTGIAGSNPVPLSPDALTAFSNGDPEARDRNTEITEATQFLLTKLVPAAAKLFCSKSPAKLDEMNLATELHKYGINMRHIGLLRAYISPSSRIPAGVGGAAALARSFYGAGSAHTTVTGEGSGSGGGSGGSRRGNHSKDDGARPSAGVEFASSGRSSEAVMRDRVLVEVVVRTLKLVLREFQRRWMKSEQSSSEQGMHLLVAEFLNLVTGSHVRSALFWKENVTVGVCQRFGTVALTDSERAGLWDACTERPELLRLILKELVRVTGVRFKESVNQRLRRKSAQIVKFKFTRTDIRDIEAVVTPMEIFLPS